MSGPTTTKPYLGLTFVQPTQHSSTRKKNLEAATARSHAAKVAHQRRKEREGPFKIETLRPPPVPTLRSTSYKPAQAKGFRKCASTEDVANKAKVKPRVKVEFVQQSIIPRAYHGSSDPFDCFSVSINPRLNSVIAFVRNVYLPSVFVTSYSLRFSRIEKLTPSIMQDELAMGSRFANGDCMYGMEPDILPIWVSFHAVSIAPHLSAEIKLQMERLYLNTCGHRLSLIRKRIAETGTLSPSDIFFVALFFRMACCQNEHTAAKVHAQALSLVKRASDPTLELKIHLQLIFPDACFAIEDMRRTILPPGESGPHRSVQSFWAYIESMLPPVAMPWEAVPDAIENELIRTILKRLRRCFALCEQGMTIESPEQKKYASLIYSWVATTSGYGLGVLLNRYLDLVEFKTEDMSEGKRYTEAALCMMLCYVIRKGVCECKIDGVDFRDLSEVLCTRAEDALEKAMLSAASEERRKYTRLWLWICSLGAHYEARVAMGLVWNAKKGGEWFGTFLRELVRTTNLQRWSQLKPVLDAFVLLEFLEPPMEGWYETVVMGKSSTGIFLAKHEPL